MKRSIFMAVLFMLSISAAAQSYYGYDDDIYASADAADYTYDVANGLDLTGEQWHTNEASILAANNCQYIVVRGPARSLYTLGPLNVPAYEQLWHHRISLYQPYYYNSCLGWYAVAGLIHYFIYPNGQWCRLSFEPCYYPYRYHIAHCRRINFHGWHFWHGRHNKGYHGTCYRPGNSAVHRSHSNYHERNQRHYKQAPVRNSYEGRSQHRYSEQQKHREKNVSSEPRRPAERPSVRNNSSSNHRNHYAPADRHRSSRSSGSEQRTPERGGREHSRGRR